MGLGPSHIEAASPGSCQGLKTEFAAIILEFWVPRGGSGLEGEARAS